MCINNVTAGLPNITLRKLYKIPKLTHHYTRSVSCEEKVLRESSSSDSYPASHIVNITQVRGLQMCGRELVILQTLVILPTYHFHFRNGSKQCSRSLAVTYAKKVIISQRNTAYVLYCSAAVLSPVQRSIKTHKVRAAERLVQ